jgi:hypothetical protein
LILLRSLIPEDSEIVFALGHLMMFPPDHYTAVKSAKSIKKTKAMDDDSVREVDEGEDKGHDSQHNSILACPVLTLFVEISFKIEGSVRDFDSSLFT